MIDARAVFACGLLVFASTGCASRPAAPFDTLPQSQVTAYKLQNFEPPQNQQPQAGGGIPNWLPGPVRDWVQQQGQQWLPELGGIIPGLGGAATPAPPDAPRFPPGLPPQQSFRIIRSTAVMNEELKEELAHVFGTAGHFNAERRNCMYPEFGLTFASPGAPPNHLLISLACNEVRAVGFAWPHPNFGMTANMREELHAVEHKIWAN